MGPSEQLVRRLPERLLECPPCLRSFGRQVFFMPRSFRFAVLMLQLSFIAHAVATEGALNDSPSTPQAVQEWQQHSSIPALQDADTASSAMQLESPTADSWASSATTILKSSTAAPIPPTEADKASALSSTMASKRRQGALSRGSAPLVASAAESRTSSSTDPLAPAQQTPPKVTNFSSPQKAGDLSISSMIPPSSTQGNTTVWPDEGALSGQGVPHWGTTATLPAVSVNAQSTTLPRSPTSDTERFFARVPTLRKPSNPPTLRPIEMLLAGQSFPTFPSPERLGSASALRKRWLPPQLGTIKSGN